MHAIESEDDSQSVLSSVLIFKTMLKPLSDYCEVTEFIWMVRCDVFMYITCTPHFDIQQSVISDLWELRSSQVWN